MAAAFRRSLSLASRARYAVKGSLLQEPYHSSSLQLLSSGIPEKSVSEGATTKTNEKAGRLQPVQVGGYNALIDSAKQRTDIEKREQFALALDEFVRREKYRKGHVAFIRVAMQRLEEFGLEKDLETYNKIIDVFPRGKFAPRRMIDAFWPRSTPQLELCLQLLTKMEEQGVRPSGETYDIVKAVFGWRSLPLEKCARIMYLFDKYGDIDPYEIRVALPVIQSELSRLALFRMAGKDGQLMELQMSDDAIDFVIGGNSLKQLQLLERLEGEGLSEGTFLHVEGPHRLWLKKMRQYYFTIRLSEAKEDISASVGQTIDEDVVLGVCMCNPASREKLQCWIKELQERYSCLSDLNIIYDLSLEDPDSTNDINSAALPAASN